MFHQVGISLRFHIWCTDTHTSNITYSEIIFVALFTHRVMRNRHIVNWGLSGSTLHFHIIKKNGKNFEEKLLDVNMWSDFFSTDWWKYIYCSSSATMFMRASHNIMNTPTLRVLLEILCILWVSEENYFLAVSTVYVNSFSRKTYQIFIIWSKSSPSASCNCIISVKV